MINTYSYIRAIATERNGSPERACTTDAPTRASVQALKYAQKLMANIGAWNTASVTEMAWVCAAFGRRRAPWRTHSDGVRCGAAVVRGGTADVRVRIHVRARFRQQLACAGVHVCIPSCA